MIRFFGIIFSLMIASSGCAAGQEGQVLVAGQSKVTKRQYNLETFAEYLGLNMPQYMKFVNAFSDEQSAIDAGPGFVLAEHSAMVQIRSLQRRGLKAPEALVTEARNLFAKYNAGMAEYVGVSSGEYQKLFQKFAYLMDTIGELEGANFRLAKPNGEVQNSTGDDIERIEIIATEQVIIETSSGGFTSLITIIWNAGLDRNPGFGGVVVPVRFVSSNSNFVGTQEFRVTRGNVVRESNITCGGESCSFGEF